MECRTEGQTQFYSILPAKAGGPISTTLATVIDACQDATSNFKGCCCENGGKRNKIELKNCNEYRSGCLYFCSVRSCAV